MEKAKKQTFSLETGRKFVDFFCTYGLYIIFAIMVVFFYSAAAELFFFK